MKRNLTIQLDEETVVEAKVLAAPSIDIGEQAGLGITGGRVRASMRCARQT